MSDRRDAQPHAKPHTAQIRDAVRFDAPDHLMSEAREFLQRAGDGLLRLHWVWQAVVIYAVTRFITLCLAAAVARHQGDTPWNGPEGPTLAEFLSFWDGGWYERIALEGYPDVLPVAETGQVAQNAWAFYPLHPWLAKLLSDVSGLDYQVASPVLSVFASLVAAILMLRLFRMHLSAGQAASALAFFFTYPATATLMSGYSESLALMFLLIALSLVIERHYLSAIIPVALMDISRPMGVGFAFFMLIHLIDRYRRRGDEPYPTVQVMRAWTLGVLSCAAALIHPAVAWMVTGSLSAYTDTEAAWTDHDSPRLLVQWIERSQTLAGPAGPVLLVVGLALFLIVIIGPVGRSMGRVHQQWVIAYTAYLLIFFNPQSSTFRLLLPMFPLAVVFARRSSWTLRLTVIGASILLQIWWLRGLWYLSSWMTPP